MNEPRNIYSGLVNGKPVEGIAFLYRGNLDKEHIFRWGVRLRFTNGTVRRMELTPSPYEGVKKEKAYDRAEKFMLTQLGLEQTEAQGLPGAW